MAGKDEVQKELFKEAKSNGKEELLFFLAIKDKKKKGNFVVYTSEQYRLTEQDLIDIIKILYVNRRAVSLGRKIMSAYFDSTDYSPTTYENLSKIGVEMKKDEPENSAKVRTV
ncbi:hypothetical protein CCP3SC1AL1_520014 [Gammaproteobacteria bacterium]